MRKLLGLIAVFSIAAFAQEPQPPQPPNPPNPPGFFQAPGDGQGAASQLRAELNGLPFVGGSYLGVGVAEIDANRAKELKLKEDYGVEITRVEQNSPAEKAGLKPGDVVLEYNRERVEGMEQFGRLVRETPPGRDVKLTVSRDGKTQMLTAMVASRRSRFPENFPPVFQMPQFEMPDIPRIYTTVRSRILGVEAESLGPQLASYFGVKEGVLVRSVLENTPAQKAGIKAGDVITKVDGMAVTTPSEVSSSVRMASTKKSYPIELTRDRKPMIVNVNVEDRSERRIPRVRTLGDSFTN